MSRQIPPAPLVEILRGPFVESMHFGHAVVADATGEILFALGNPEEVILPRSAIKMFLALPLVESGAAEAAGLTSRHLALACASHNGAALHVGMVEEWLRMLGLGDEALRCGPHIPLGDEPAAALFRSLEAPRRVHNNCSGKHAGFLTLSSHLGADEDPNYVAPGHPVQRAALAAFEEVTGATSPGLAVDGCSAPNFATSIKAMAHGLARFAAAREEGMRGRAMVALREAMMVHPELVAGEGRACTQLMRTAPGRIALKTGAEGVYAAILPERGLGIALKATDGAKRAAESAIAALAVGFGALDGENPVVKARLNPTIRNWAGIVTGEVRPAELLRKLAGLG